MVVKVKNPGSEHGRPTVNGTIIRTFWTNFERDSPEEFEVSNEEMLAEGWWSFRTNIDWEDMSLFWDKAQLKRFLFSMWDIYRYRKVT